MIVERREFLRLLGLAAGTAGAGGCSRFWSVPDDLVALAARGPGLETEVQTICGLCESGCGLTVRMIDGLPVGLKGSSHHPLNRGGMCPVGKAGLDLLYFPDRIHSPLRRSHEGELVPTTWEAALAEIATRLSALRDSGHPERLAVLSGEQSALFHDLVRQVMSAFGSPNLARADHDDRLVYELTQGLSEPPGFDLARSDLVMSFGLDVYESGPVPVHAIAAMIGSRATEDRARIVHVGTRLSPSAAKADQRVLVHPGTHAAFALGVANVLVREGRIDRRFVDEHTHGFDDWEDGSGQLRRGLRRLLMEDYYPDRAALLCGCEAEEIVVAARRFAAASAPLALAGEEATRGSNGTWTAMAVHALNALVGAFDRPGGVVLAPPVPLAPLPPLEVSGLAPSLFEAPVSSGALGADPVEALAGAILDRGKRLDVLLVVEADPLFESAGGRRLREALARVPLVVACAQLHDETTAVADLVLPAPTFLERWQAATTPPTVSFSTLGVTAPVVRPLHDTRHPADVLLELGRRTMGAQATAALPWDGWPDYVRARIDGVLASGQGAVVTGSFEESWVQYLEERGWRFQVDRGHEATWTEIVQQGGWWNPVQPRGEWSRLFATPSGRYEFYSLALEARLRALGAAEGQLAPGSQEALQRGIAALGLDVDEGTACLPHFEPPQQLGEGEATLVPYRPITARGRLGACSPMVLEMFAYPALSGWETLLEMSPELAGELGVADGDRVAAQSDAGAIEAVVRIAPGTATGTAHVPLGLGHEGASAGAGIGANPLAILAPARDPLSGLRALTGTRVRIRLLRRRAHGAPAPAHGRTSS